MGVFILLAVYIFIHRNDQQIILLYNSVVTEMD